MYSKKDFKFLAQSYEILLQCVSGLPQDEQFLKVAIFLIVILLLLYQRESSLIIFHFLAMIQSHFLRK